MRAVCVRIPVASDAPHCACAVHLSGGHYACAAAAVARAPGVARREGGSLDAFMGARAQTPGLRAAVYAGSAALRAGAGVGDRCSTGQERGTLHLLPMLLSPHYNLSRLCLPVLKHAVLMPRTAAWQRQILQLTIPLPTLACLAATYFIPTTQAHEHRASASCSYLQNTTCTLLPTSAFYHCHMNMADAR